MIVDVVDVVMVFAEVFVVVHSDVVFIGNDSRLSHLFLRSVRFPATRAHDLIESEKKLTYHLTPMKTKESNTPRVYRNGGK